MSRIEEMDLEDLTKKLIKDNIEKLDEYSFCGEDLAQSMAEELWNMNNDSDLGWMSNDVQRGLQFIANNALRFEEICCELKERDIEINPLQGIEYCISNALIYSMEEVLSETSYVQEHIEDEDIELTLEGIHEMLEDLDLTNDREWER